MKPLTWDQIKPPMDVADRDGLPRRVYRKERGAMEYGHEYDTLLASHEYYVNSPFLYPLDPPRCIVCGKTDDPMNSCAGALLCDDCHTNRQTPPLDDSPTATGCAMDAHRRMRPRDKWEKHIESLNDSTWNQNVPDILTAIIHAIQALEKREGDHHASK